MKLAFIHSAAAIILLFQGCSKDLPPEKCNELLFEYAPYGSSPFIDSVYVRLERTDIPNGDIFEAMLYDPAASIPFSFCGVFRYKVKVYSAQQGIKYQMQLFMNGDYKLLGGPLMVNGLIYDDFEYEAEFLY